MGPGSAAHHSGRCFASPGVLRCVRGTRAAIWRALSQCRHCEEPLRRSNPESFRGQTLDCFAALAMTEYEAIARLFQLAFNAQTRLCILAAHSPELCTDHTTPNCQRAQGRPGAGRAPTVHCAKIALQEAAQRHTGVAKHPAFPAQWVYGLCRALPGERCTIAPVALPIADARTRLGRHITARLDAQTPGVRTTRFCRTPITPVVCARYFAHGSPPCKTLRAGATGVHHGSPHVRDDRDTPL